MEDKQHLVVALHLHSCQNDDNNNIQINKGKPMQTNNIQKHCTKEQIAWMKTYDQTLLTTTLRT